MKKKKKRTRKKKRKNNKKNKMKVKANKNVLKVLLTNDIHHHKIGVCRQPGQQSAGGEGGQRVGEHSSHVTHERERVGDAEHRQPAYPVREDPHGQRAEHGADEEGGLTERWLPVAVAYPVQLEQRLHFTIKPGGKFWHGSDHGKMCRYLYSCLISIAYKQHYVFQKCFICKFYTASQKKGPLIVHLYFF